MIEQQEKEKVIDTLGIYDQIKEIGQSSVEYLKKGDVEKLGKAMDNHWKIKKQLTKNMSNNSIDKMYIELKSFGSPGGKIIGAGGGGFFLMVVDTNREQFIQNATKKGYKFVDFEFEFQGAHTVK